MQRFLMIPVAALAMAACSPKTPNDTGYGYTYVDDPSEPFVIAAENRLDAADATGAAAITRDTVQDEQQRQARAASQYTVVPAVEVGSTEGTVDLVAYAANAPNKVGEKIHKRGVGGSVGLGSRCDKYTANQAQTLFLQSGGPQRDKKRLDPDGDGFACQWNPEEFRSLL